MQTSAETSPGAGHGPATEPGSATETAWTRPLLAYNRRRGRRRRSRPPRAPDPYDTSRDEGIQEAFAFLKGWLEARSISHVQYDRGLPSLVAAVGDGPRTVVWNAHVDVVPGRAEQFSPWRVNGRVYGRGAYDMKGGLAGMLAALADLADARDRSPASRSSC